MFILITGGSGSGKSAYAEQRVLELGEGNRFYVATMMCFDEESRRRVQRHQRMRAGKGFETVECFLNLKDLQLPGDGLNLAQDDRGLPGGGRELAREGRERTTVLLECMSNLVANEMFDPRGSREAAVREIQTGIDRLLGKCDNLVVVTNEVFSDGLRYSRETEQYREALGAINRCMAGLADEVVEVVYGFPLRWKTAAEKSAAWEFSMSGKSSAGEFSIPGSVPAGHAGRGGREERL